MSGGAAGSATPAAPDSPAVPATPAASATPGRIRAFDLARGLAVGFMILIHVLGHFGNAAAWASPIGAVVMFLGGPLAAPVFMFLMGASLALSRRSTALGIAQRGLWLLALAYTLNVLRGGLPATIGLATGVVTDESIAPYTTPILLTMVDIHHMAGLSLLVIAGLAVVRRQPLAALGLGAAAVLVAPVLWGISTGIGPLDHVLALLWGRDWYVFFPLFGWIAYPLAGLAYGTLLVRSPDPHRFIRRGAVLGAAVGVGGLALLATVDPFGGIDDYWRQGPGTVLAIVGLGMAWLAACDVLVGRVRSNQVFDLLYGWSGRVTAMYCLHWILIGWSVGLVGHRQLDLPSVLVAMGVVMVATHAIVRRLPPLRVGQATAGDDTAPAPTLATT